MEEAGAEAGLRGSRILLFAQDDGEGDVGYMMRDAVGSVPYGADIQILHPA